MSALLPQSVVSVIGPRRPKGSPEYKFVGCKIPGELLLAIDQICEQQKATRSEVMRALLCKALRGNSHAS
jgi:hypothetical protein